MAKDETILEKKEEAPAAVQICFRSLKGDRTVVSCPCQGEGLVQTQALFTAAADHCAAWIPPDFRLVFRGALIDKTSPENMVDLTRFGTIFVAEARASPVVEEPPEVHAEDFFSDNVRVNEPPTHTDNANNTNNAGTGRRDHENQPFGRAETGPPPTCRICFGTESESSGNLRLFRPCRCAGSLQYVHVGCLNQWRRSSANTDSYLRCVTCQYSYNTQYTDLARRIDTLATDEGSLALSCMFLAIVVGLSASLVQLLGLERSVLQLTHFRSMYYSQIPYGKELCEGLFVVGGIGFSLRMVKTLLWLYRMRDLVTIEFIINQRDVQAFGTIFLSYGNTAALRTAVSIGVVYFVYTLVVEIKAIVKYCVQEFGEIILEVQPTANPSSNVDATSEGTNTTGT